MLASGQSFLPEVMEHHLVCPDWDPKQQTASPCKDVRCHTISARHHLSENIEQGHDAQDTARGCAKPGGLQQGTAKLAETKCVSQACKAYLPQLTFG